MSRAPSEAALASLRIEIDAIDDRLVALVAERMACIERVVVVKQATGLPARLEGRVEEVVARVRAKAEQAGAPPELAETLWRTMIEWVIGFEEKAIKKSLTNTHK